MLEGGVIACEGLSLVPVGISRLLELEELFMEEPELHYLAARRDKPEVGALMRRLAKGVTLRVWDIVPVEVDTTVGYLSFNPNTCASPLFTIFIFDEEMFDPALVVRACVGFARFFARALAPDEFGRIYPEWWLNFITPKPVSAALRSALVRAGFDEETEVSETDPEVEAVFRLQHYTYAAYYDAADEDAGEGA